MTEFSFARKPAVGTWITTSDVKVLDAICSSEILDFVILDEEHGTCSSTSLLELIRVCQFHGVLPIYRPPYPSTARISHALDSGCVGLQVPNISTVQQALSVVESCLFPPLGNRGFSPFVPANSYDPVTSAQVVSSSNNDIFIGDNVEGPEGLSNFDAIASINDISAIFLGLFDISKSLGIPGEISHPDVLSVLQDYSKIAHHHNKLIGSIATTPSELSNLVQSDFDYILYGVDMCIVRNAYSQISQVISR